ncbi:MULTISPECIES: benzoate/H(+) symporter BenE family transporter [unclassified Salinibacterium]|uniref:benzoate/H(+) symporter BenE family transporter n=1 Tax=unclassified Salinibacterium TaxID=2632331 RepID=UPI001420CA01|nr:MULTISPECIES: benzoate/H(+) symporter BenE family transporter [unclassified Salinibacterium]
MTTRELAQPIGTGIVGALTGFASSFAIVVAGLHAVGASDADAASGLLALTVMQGLLCIVFGLRYRMPLSFAWSTPGAALLVAAQATTGDFRAAVGAFLVCGALLTLTGVWPWLARAMTRIPKPIASAMLAGILFPICLAPVLASIELPHLALPIVLVWLVLARLAPRWAVPGAVVTTVVAVIISGEASGLELDALVPVLTVTWPVFDPAVIVGLGIPLYVVTMAGQNVPGFAVLTTFGYPHPPARAMLAGSGIATMASTVFGGHALNLAAITAAMMAGPDAHPDRDRRWIATVTCGVAYLVLGVGAGAATSLVAVTPPLVITAVAGLALFGALASAASSAFEEPPTRVVAVITFLVVASGVAIAGIGSAFWGLVVGGIAMIWLSWRPRRRLGAVRV